MPMAKSPEERKSEAAAAKWHARLLCADVSVEERGAFEAWRTASETNARAWDKVQAAWKGLGELDDHPLVARWRKEALAAGPKSKRDDSGEA